MRVINDTLPPSSSRLLLNASLSVSFFAGFIKLEKMRRMQLWKWVDGEMKLYWTMGRDMEGDEDDEYGEDYE
jgi:hypothetical protein